MSIHARSSIYFPFADNAETEKNVKILLLMP